MHPAPLPAHLARRPFAVAGSGLSPARLRASDLDRTVWGVRRGGPSTMLDRCAMFAVRLAPELYFSHATAALILGAPLPPALEHRPELDVSAPHPSRAPHAAGILGHRSVVLPADITSRGPVRHTTAGRTWIDLSTQLALEDLVAVGDYFIHWRTPLCSLEDLRERTLQRRGCRGFRTATQAVDLLDARAESRQESHLRVILTLAGIRDFAVNYVVVSTETGRNVRLDLAFPGKMVVLEYQGDYHRTARQWRKDMTRRSQLEAAGWYVMEINVDDLRNPTELVARIQRVLAGR
ncbi:MAG: hypothetical protein ACOH10_08425 [Rhodoglobus sp.]